MTERVSRLPRDPVDRLSRIYRGWPSGSRLHYARALAKLGRDRLEAAVAERIARNQQGLEDRT